MMQSSQQITYNPSTSKGGLYTSTSGGDADPGLVKKFKLWHRFLVLISFFLCLISLIIHFVAFFTPYWIVSDGDSPFEKLGFHEVCFRNCHFPYCPGDPDIIYNGCYTWAFNELIFASDQFRELVQWIMPTWFLTCKNIFIGVIVFLLICIFLLLICTCWAYKPLYTPSSPKKKDICSIVLGFTTIFMLVLTTLLIVAGISIFSSLSPHREYMPLAYKNHFGSSFWLEISASALTGVSALLTYFSSITKVIHYVKPKDITYAEDME